MITIWHNSRCSKSRQPLALLHDQGHAPVVVDYLKTPPSAHDIQSVLAKLGAAPIDIMRTKETRFKDLGLTPDISDQVAIEVMVANPILIERPIVITDTAAAIGRPPEAVLDIL